MFRFILLLACIVFLNTSCVKQQDKATALITVLNHTGRVQPDAYVNFYVASNTIKKGSLDTTIKTDRNGNAQFARYQECFLDVLAIKTFDSLYTVSGSCTIRMIPGQSVSRTIYLK